MRFLKKVWGFIRWNWHGLFHLTHERFTAEFECGGSCYGCFTCDRLFWEDCHDRQLIESLFSPQKK